MNSEISGVHLGMKRHDIKKHLLSEGWKLTEDNEAAWFSSKCANQDYRRPTTNGDTHLIALRYSSDYQAIEVHGYRDVPFGSRGEVSKSASRLGSPSCIQKKYGEEYFWGTGVTNCEFGTGANNVFDGQVPIYILTYYVSEDEPIRTLEQRVLTGATEADECELVKF